MEQNQPQNGLTPENQTPVFPQQILPPPQSISPPLEAPSIAATMASAPIYSPPPIQPTAPQETSYHAAQSQTQYTANQPTFDVDTTNTWDTTAAPVAKNTQKPINRLALIGFCLSVGSWIFNYLTFCLMGVAGIVVSVLAMKRMDKEKENYAWMPLVGIIVGAAATLVDGIIIGSLLALFGLPVLIGFISSLGSL